jgi:hypothetical protein
VESTDGPQRKGASPAGAAWLALVPAVGLVFASTASRASDVELLNIGIRVRVGEKRVLGEQHPESFRAYDLFTTIRLPWEERFATGWPVGLRVLASAGVLQGADKTALVVSAIPVLAFGLPDWRFTLDLGAGLAFMSRHHYAQQDFGGPVQAALTLGFSVPLYERIGVGYRFLHYSDGGAYGSGTIGADFHTIELLYRF